MQLQLLYVRRHLNLLLLIYVGVKYIFFHVMVFQTRANELAAIP